MTTISNEEKEVPKEKVDKEKKCGIIMPIADTNGYPKGHWTDVLNILCEAIRLCFSLNLLVKTMLLD